MCKKNRTKEYYKNNRDVILNRSKEYYTKESTVKHLKNKYESLTKDKKQKMKDYQKEYQKEYKKDMSDEQKQKLKDYRKEYYKKYYAEKKIIIKMNNTFISMLRDIDFLYGFIYKCACLTNDLYGLNNYDHLVLELCNNFVLPIINITKDKHKKEYNIHVKYTKNVDNICLYLMYICAEKYFKLTQDEYLKTKKFIDNNIDTVEAILPPMHEFFDLSKKCYDSYCYSPCNCHCKQNNRKLLINILNFVKKIVLF